MGHGYQPRFSYPTADWRGNVMHGVVHPTLPEVGGNILQRMMVQPTLPGEAGGNILQGMMLQPFMPPVPICPTPPPPAGQEEPVRNYAAIRTALQVRMSYCNITSTVPGGVSSHPISKDLANYSCAASCVYHEFCACL